MERGIFKFEVTLDGTIINNFSNAEILRNLWLDRSLVSGNHLGPGDPGDFDNGAWHIACHLLAAAGVRQAANGGLLWLEISHRCPDEYYASITFEKDGKTHTLPLDSDEGISELAGSTLLGFVEGNSQGHISSRDVIDCADRFNGWLRQNFDQQIGVVQDGGKVWEHWCTVRDLRPSCNVATSVLKAYIALLAALGDLFPATVARGRREYGHPMQLCALVRAGLIGESSATRDISPLAIPSTIESLLQEARPEDSLKAIKQLQWSNPPRYYMFGRMIDKWSSATAVRADLRNTFE